MFSRTDILLALLALVNARPALPPYRPTETNMRKLAGLALIVTGTVLLAFTSGVTAPAPKDEFIWTRAVAAGRATWPEACAEPRRPRLPRGAGPCAPGKWPLASQPLI